MEITINKLIEFCEEEEYIHRSRCKQYDAASGFTRTGNKDIRTACAFSEEIKSNHYQQMIDIMRKYQKIQEIIRDYDVAWESHHMKTTIDGIREVIENDDGTN